MKFNYAKTRSIVLFLIALRELGISPRTYWSIKKECGYDGCWCEFHECSIVEAAYDWR